MAGPRVQASLDERTVEPRRRRQDDATAPGTTRGTSYDAVLRLQREGGNRAVARLLGESGLRVGDVDSEAERVADRSSGGRTRRSTGDSPLRRGGFDPGPDFAARLRESGPGTPLPPGVGQAMSRRLGFDAGRARIHTGETASDLATGIGAKAFAHGHDVYVGEQVDLTTAEGADVLAHELTHVGQSAAAAVPAGQVSRDPDDDLIEQMLRSGRISSRGMRQAELAARSRPTHAYGGPGESTDTDTRPPHAYGGESESGESESTDTDTRPTHAYGGESESGESESTDTDTRPTHAYGGTAEQPVSEPKKDLTMPGIVKLERFDPAAGLQGKAKGAKYEGEHVKAGGWRMPNAPESPRMKTLYYNDQEREASRARPDAQSGGRLRDTAGRKLSGARGWVMDPENANLHTFQDSAAYRVNDDGRRSRVTGGWSNVTRSGGSALGTHHTSPLAGKPVAGAGMLHTKRGAITKITDESGHYAPEAQYTHQSVDAMAKQGMKLDREMPWEDKWGDKVVDPETGEHVTGNVSAKVQLTGFDNTSGRPVGKPWLADEPNMSKKTLSLPYQTFLQTGGDEKQIRLRAGVGDQIKARGQTPAHKPGEGLGDDERAKVEQKISDTRNKRAERETAARAKHKKDKKAGKADEKAERKRVLLEARRKLGLEPPESAPEPQLEPDDTSMFESESEEETPLPHNYAKLLPSRGASGGGISGGGGTGGAGFSYTTSESTPTFGAEHEGGESDGDEGSNYGALNIPTFAPEPKNKQTGGAGFSYTTSDTTPTFGAEHEGGESDGDEGSNYGALNIPTFAPEPKKKKNAPNYVIG